MAPSGVLYLFEIVYTGMLLQWGTALHQAAAEGRTDTVEVLLKRGADCHTPNQVRPVKYSL